MTTAATPEATPPNALKIATPSRGDARKPRFSSRQARGMKTTLSFSTCAACSYSQSRGEPCLLVTPVERCVFK